MSSQSPEVPDDLPLLARLLGDRRFWLIVIACATLIYLEQLNQARFGQGGRGGQVDLAQFYEAARVVTGQESRPLYTPIVYLRPANATADDPRVPVFDYPYSPFVAVAVAPLARLSLSTAGVLWFAGNEIMTLLGLLTLLRLWRDQLTLPRLGVLLVVYALSEPIIHQQALGNTQSIQLLFAALALALLLRRWDLPAGFLLGVLVLIKPFWLLFALSFLVTRRWQALAGLLGALPLGVLATWPVFGSATGELWRQWATEVVPSYGSVIWAYDNLSLSALVARATHIRSLLEPAVPSDWVRPPDPTEINFAPAWLRLFALASGAAVVAITLFWLWRAAVWRRRDSDAVSHSSGLTLTASLLATTVLWPHFLMLLLIPITALLLASFAGRLPIPAVGALVGATLILDGPITTSGGLWLRLVAVVILWALLGWALRALRPRPASAPLPSPVEQSPSAIS